LIDLAGSQGTKEVWNVCGWRLVVCTVSETNESWLPPY